MAHFQWKQWMQGTLLLICGLVVHAFPSGTSKSFAQTTVRATAPTRGLDDPPEPSEPWVKLNYPRSRILTGIELDESTRRTESPGSDIWPITWADDGHQYTAFGDGGGFGGNNQDGRASMGVSRVEGNHDDYVGINVWGGKNAENPAQFEGKGTGIVSVDGVLYMWVAAPTILSKTTLAVSRDHSRTWQQADWHWAMEDRLYAGVFVNCGRDHSEAPDDLVYSCFTRIASLPAAPRNWIYERPGQVDLARAPKHRLLEKSAWEWFAGTSENGEPDWTSDLAQRQPIFEDENGIKVVSVCWQPSLRRWLLMYTPRDTGGHFALFEAPQSWGPWSEVAYWKDHPLFMPPRPNSRVSIYHFAPKWWQSEGREFTLIFNVGDDAWNTVRGHFRFPAAVDEER